MAKTCENFLNIDVPKAELEAPRLVGGDSEKDEFFEHGVMHLWTNPQIDSEYPELTKIAQ